MKEKNCKHLGIIILEYLKELSIHPGMELPECGMSPNSG